MLLREDARQANEELFIRDDNDKVFKNLISFPNTGEGNNFRNSDLDLASNLSSSTELEADIEHEEEKIERRSKKPIKPVQLLDIITQCHDYKKHHRKHELGSNGYGDEQPQLIQTTDNSLTSRTDIHRDNHKCQDRLPVHKAMYHWRNHLLTEIKQNPIGQTTANSERGNVEDSDRTIHNN